MGEAYIQRAKKLKKAILNFLAGNDRHYGDLTRHEQGVEDLAQALNTRLDQLLMCLTTRQDELVAEEGPRERLSRMLLDTAVKLDKGGTVDAEMADGFEQALAAFDVAADLRRRADGKQDQGETAALKHKRDRGK